MTDPGSYPLTYTGYYDAEHRPVQGGVPVEEAVALHVNGQPLVVLMCTPTQLEELALGFLFGAGLIVGRDDVDEAQVLDLPDGRRWLDVWLRREIEPSGLRAMTSGCSGGVAFEGAGAALRRIGDGSFSPQNWFTLWNVLKNRLPVPAQVRRLKSPLEGF